MEAKMKRVKRIKNVNVMQPFNLSSWIAMFLLFDKFNASEWLWGVFFTLAIVSVFLYIFYWSISEPFDLINHLQKKGIVEYEKSN